MGWGGEGKNPDIVLITVLNFRWEKPCSFREKWIFWKFRHDARKIYNNLIYNNNGMVQIFQPEFAYFADKILR